VDTTRKNIRLVDSQYFVTQRRKVFIDLETGDRSVIPLHWDEQKIQKALYHAERLNNPMTVAVRPVKRVRWTTLVGDIIVYDDWSPYDKYTIVPFFPYFRRGQTRGMIDDLIDPQKEKNKRRSNEIEIVGRTTNTGWLYHENALDPMQEAKLEKFGASPGIRLKWKGENSQKPERINPAPPPMAMERLEQKAEEDLRKISGINESTLGELDRVQSGRAIEARQRQAVMGFQLYMDNWSRTTEMKGRKVLNLVQKTYTEPRLIRIMGEDGKLVQTMINQRQANPDAPDVIDRINDVTVGKYNVVVDETPMSASFRSAQFEEALAIIEKLGPSLGPNILALGGMLIDMSSFPKKEEFKEQLGAAVQDAQQQQQDGTLPNVSQPGGGTGGSQVENVIPIRAGGGGE
jgi:hypothetical protein